MSVRSQASSRPPVSDDRRRLLARVHQLKKQMGLDDDTYRAKLMATSGKTSAGDLSDGSLRELLNLWTRDLPAAARAPYVGADRRAVGTLKEPFQRFVRALWIALYNLGEVEDGGDKALDAFVERQAKVASLRFLRAGDAPGVTEALKDWCRRVGFNVPERRASQRTPDGASQGTEARMILVRAQWARLYALNAITVPFEDSLMNWMERQRLITSRRGLVQLTEDQLDTASKALGVWIRKAKAK